MRMDRRVALGLALTSAALAVAVVAVDLQFNVTVSLQAQQDGEWVVVASQDADGYAVPRYGSSWIGCAGPELRLVIDNGQLWATELGVSVVANDYSTGRSERLVDETVSVDRGETAIVAFTAPDWLLNVTADPSKPGGPGSIDVQIGNTYLNTCVEEA